MNVLPSGAWGIPPRGQRNMYGVLYTPPPMAFTVPRIVEALKKEPGYWQFAPGAWLVSSDKSADQLRNDLMQVAPKGTRLFVFQAGPWWAASGLDEDSPEIKWVRGTWPSP